jgi:hypothetical protein
MMWEVCLRCFRTVKKSKENCNLKNRDQSYNDPEGPGVQAKSGAARPSNALSKCMLSLGAASGNAPTISMKNRRAKVSSVERRKSCFFNKSEFACTRRDTQRWYFLRSLTKA